VQVRARLDVDPDQVRARRRVRGDPALGVLDHQVDVERQRRRAPHRLDHDRPDRQVRHEVAVHHVDVDVVRRADGGDLLGEPPEVGGQDRRRDADGWRRHARTLAPPAARGEAEGDVARRRAG
jgi:hypothetical protein